MAHEDDLLFSARDMVEVYDKGTHDGLVSLREALEISDQETYSVRELKNLIDSIINQKTIEQPTTKKRKPKLYS